MSRDDERTKLSLSCRVLITPFSSLISLISFFEFISYRMYDPLSYFMPYGKRGPTGRERGWSSWEGAAGPFPSAGGLGERCKLPQRTLYFRSILEPQKSHQNGQLPFESGGGNM